MTSILLVGATGYIGGSILSQLLTSSSISLQPLQISVLVRREQQAEKLRSIYGERIKTVYWPGLHETRFIEQLAVHYDIIINAGSGFVVAGAKAFVDGLARRIEAGLPAPWLLHISGCTNLVDLEGEAVEWDDGRDGEAVFEHLKTIDAKDPYPQRTAEVTVLETAAELGVQAVSVQTGCVFGQGTGLFNQQGLVIPLVLRYATQHGYGFKLNDKASFDWVHILDLADYFVLLLRTILERPDRGIGYIPSGKAGVHFPTVGRALLTDINTQALKTMFEAGVLPRKDTPQSIEIHPASLQVLADEITGGFVDVAQRGWGGEKGVKGTIGRKVLGWEPKRLQKAWEQEFEDELQALQEGRRANTIAGCVGEDVKAP